MKKTALHDAAIRSTPPTIPDNPPGRFDFCGCLCDNFINANVNKVVQLPYIGFLLTYS